MNNQAKDAIVVIGALAELCGEFYRQLMRQGFSQAEALQLTSDYLRTTITPRPKTDT